MAMILPFLLVLILGIVEFGSLFGASHTLTSIAREGANIASRGAPLDTVNALMLEIGAEVDLAGHGGAITSLVVIQDSVPEVREQAKSATYKGLSRLGNIGEPAAGLDDLVGAEGVGFYVVELFYGYDEKTPLRRVFGTAVPDTLYSRAIF